MIFLKEIKVIKITIVLLLLLIIVTGIILFCQVKEEKSVSLKLQTLDIVDFDNDNLLVKQSNNIFIGQVIEKAGDKKYGGGRNPQTQFKVKVIKSIKGKIDNKDIFVHQEAGYFDDKLIAAPGVSLLEKNNIYLMFTMGGKTKSEEVKYALITHKKGFDKILSLQDNKNLSELINIINSNYRVKEIQDIYKKLRITKQ